MLDTSSCSSTCFLSSIACEPNQCFTGRHFTRKGVETGVGAEGRYGGGRPVGGPPAERSSQSSSSEYSSVDVFTKGSATGRSVTLVVVQNVGNTGAAAPPAGGVPSPGCCGCIIIGGAGAAPGLAPQDDRSNGMAPMDLRFAALVKRVVPTVPPADAFDVGVIIMGSCRTSSTIRSSVPLDDSVRPT